MSQRPSIAIIGAGPGGLTAANILCRHGWQCTLFESDPSATARDQGGTLDLHPDDGQVALERAGLLEAFLAVARHEDQEQRLRDFLTGALLREEIPEPGTGDCPEIDRSVLRELMLAPLDPQTIHWNTRIKQVQTRPDGRHELICDANRFGPFDLVIGADGAWSRIRTQLTDVRPIYSGVTFVELWLTDVDRLHPELAAFVGHGTMLAFHGGAGLIAQRNGNACIRVYAAFQTSDDTSKKIDKSQLLTRFSNWAPALRALISASDKIVAIRPISALPKPLGWPHQDGVTLIGDAAHLMPPLGVGVNLAMLDASDLAIALVTNDDWRVAQRQYETLMLERATSVLETITTSFNDWFGHEATQVIMDHMDTRQ